MPPDPQPPTLARGTVDRAAHRRQDDDWLAAAWTDANSRVFVVDDGRSLVRDESEIVFFSPNEAPAGERFFLGVDADVAYWAVAGPLPRALDARPLGLREIGALLDDRTAGLLVHAIALANWHAAHTRCPRCGTPTDVTHAGHVRRCPNDGSEHFPRTDPAVIMLVHDGTERCVLGRQPSWPPRRFSTLAGFVEPGESLEMAVVREVREEVGLHVVETSYRHSQPWPFPASLMLGFFAEVSYDALSLDGAELAEARWWTRDELRSDVAAGDVLLPPPVSSAWRLINTWLDA